MNKTEIIRFIIDIVIVKLWNISSNMRKRVQMIVEKQSIRVNKYNPKALCFNGWLREGSFPESSSKQMNKGISNYSIRDQEDLDNLIKLNSTLRCRDIWFPIEKPVLFELVDRLEYRTTHNTQKSAFTCKKARYLTFFSVVPNFIKTRIAQIEEIGMLCISFQKLPKLDLSSTKIKEARFFNVEFTKKCILPDTLAELHVGSCEGVNLLKCTKLTKLEITPLTDSLDDYLKLVSTNRNLKVLKVDYEFSFKPFLDVLAPTIRVIEISNGIDSSEFDWKKIKKRFKYLICLDKDIPIEAAELLNLRAISPKMVETKREFTCRPRKIEVKMDNYRQLNKHPELFERVCKVVVHACDFDYACLNKANNPKVIEKNDVMKDIYHVTHYK